MFYSNLHTFVRNLQILSSENIKNRLWQRRTASLPFFVHSKTSQWYFEKFWCVRLHRRSFPKNVDFLIGRRLFLIVFCPNLRSTVELVRKNIDRTYHRSTCMEVYFWKWFYWLINARGWEYSPVSANVFLVHACVFRDDMRNAVGRSTEKSVGQTAARCGKGRFTGWRWNLPNKRIWE